MKSFDLSAVKPLGPDLPAPWGRGRDGRDLETDDVAGADVPDILYTRDGTAHTFIDATAAKLAADAVTRLPEPGETHHMIVSGRFPFAALIPAILDLAPGTVIDEATISTLSFSADNGRLLAELLDAGKIGRLTLIAAEVFAARSAHVYDPVAASLTRRGARVTMCRTHAKIINVRLSDGRTFTAEGSCNLRSAKSVENITVASDPGLYAFHRQWIESMTPRQKDRK